jgi:hypothetical protein
MGEYEPFKSLDQKKLEPTEMPLKGPNVLSTLDTPPHPDAIKAHDAAIRRHLKDRRSPQFPPDAS